MVDRKYVSEETRKRISDGVRNAIRTGKLNRKDMWKNREHPMKGKHHSEDTRKKLSESLKNSYKTGKISVWNTGKKFDTYWWKGRKHSEEVRKKMSEIAKERWKNGNHPMKGKPRSEETKKKLSAKVKLLWENPDYRNRTMESMRKKRPRNEYQAMMEKLPKPPKIEKISTKVKYNCKVCGKERYDYARKRNGARKFCSRECATKGKELWWVKQNRPNPRMFCRNNPTIPEIFLSAKLSEWFPNEWKYVGDGKFQIETFNPDFVNCNGKKLIIEFNGKYWHGLAETIERDKRKAECYLKYGYKTLILDDNDMKNESTLKEKIENFIGN